MKIKGYKRIIFAKFFVSAKTVSALVHTTNVITLISYKGTNIVHTKPAEQGRHSAVPSSSTGISDNGSSSILKAMKNTAL